MRSIIGSSGRDCVFIILFQLYGCRTGLSKSNLFKVGQYDLTQTFILGEELIQYQYNLIKFLSNRSKIIASQKTAGIILILTSF